MESFDGNGGSRLVVTELSQIKELVTQLEGHLPGGPRDVCQHLASQIFSIIERSIGIVTSFDFDSARKRSAADAGFDSVTPGSLSDAPFKNTKKRKMMEKRKNQVKVRSAGDGEAPVEDGHSWRKYGQKEILGAKYPRSYYRCTHRHSQECAATKQVQRTDDDPEIFDVYYVGTHTCVDKTVTDLAATAAQPPQRDPSTSLTVKTEGLAVAGEPQAWSSATTPFRFASTPASVCQRGMFCGPSTSGNGGASPATSDSNHVASSFPPFKFNGAEQWRAQSELQEVVSALVAASTPVAPGTDVADEQVHEVDDIDVSIFFA